jgi:hypothetical protein
MISTNEYAKSNSGISGLKRVPFALFLHSLSIISFQIVLMRILSVNQWDHFANMIIGIALLGFGASGSILAILRKRLMDIGDKLIPILMVLSSVSMLISYRLSQNAAFKFDSLLIFSSSEQMYRLVLFIFLFFIPFFIGAMAIGIIYMRDVGKIGTLYFANLSGSGFGGMTAIILLNFFFPHQTLLIISLFPAIASLILSGDTCKKCFYAFQTMLLLLIGWSIINPMPPVLSQFKSLSKVSQLPDAEISVMESSASSMVHIAESSYLRFAPGLSLNYTGQLPVKPMVFINGNAAGFIPHNNPDTSDILDFSTFKLPYLISEKNSVAVVSAGTGTMVAQSLRNGSRKIYAFESDLGLINSLKQWHSKNHPSVYENDAVTLKMTEARSYMQSDTNLYDLIILPPIGSFGGNSGADALKESFSLTMEALNTYWNRLTPEGSISITVYSDFPARASLKTLYSLTELLFQQSYNDLSYYIVAVRSWTAITYLVSRKAISPDEIDVIREFCHEMGFDPFLLPDIANEERVYYNYTDNKELFELTDLLMAGNTEAAKDYLFYIAPATDNKPYFSKYLKITDLGQLFDKYPKREIPYLEIGYIIVWLTFALAVIFSVLFILLPVLSFKKSGGKIPVLLYFGAIGIGFMFVEIILIQRFILYIGQPVYAVSTVLSILLIASGAGSYFSGKIDAGSKKHRVVFLIIFSILILYALFLTNFLKLTINLEPAFRIAIACLVIAIPAFFMGMPFPLGLKALRVRHNDKIAWGWGINGFFSVIATPLALIISVETGYVVVLIASIFLYLTALFAISLLNNKYGDT